MNNIIKNYNLFIFDLNNAIVDIEDYHYRAWLYVLQEELGYQFTFSFNYFCEHFHPKDSESIKNYLLNRLNLDNYNALMKHKNDIYLKILSKEKNNIKLHSGVLELLESIIAYDKNFIIVSDTFKDNIDFMIELFPLLNKAKKFYYRDMFSKKLNKECYLTMLNEVSVEYTNIIYFTFYIIVIDSLYTKDITIVYINNLLNDPFESIIDSFYPNVLYCKDYYNVDKYFLDIEIINTLRVLTTDIINHVKSGHPGSAIGCAPTLYVLWCKIMKFNPKNPLLYTRDRFIMSNGHCSILLYTLLYLLGYNYTMEDLLKFRKLNSKTCGHPEFNQELGIEVTTGPLGQGIANGVGMAIASKKLNINNNIFVLCGDGDLMEGISYEACSLAGHLKLNNLIILYDSNNITIDGSTDLTFTENIKKRFKSQDWNVLEVLNGDTDIKSIYNKIKSAQSSLLPTIIIIKTTIGYGTLKAGSNLCHGSPIGDENTVELKKKLYFDPTKLFYINDNVKEYFSLKIQELSQNDVIESLLDEITIDQIKFITYEFNNLKTNTNSYSTRDISNFCLNIINKYLNNVIFGSADLSESTKFLIKTNYISHDNYSGKYIHYGIREHAMAGIANGLSTFNFIPIISTFLVFSSYLIPSLRLSALSKHHVIYVFTHDSVWIGEDGPTHQPVEFLTILRSIKNLLVFRPCDITEVTDSYLIALKYKGPSCLILSRQSLPYIMTSYTKFTEFGGYVINEFNSPDNMYEVILIGTGSEVELVLSVFNSLINNIKCTKYYNIKILSFPCIELFETQSDVYKLNLLPKDAIKICIEASDGVYWYKYANYIYGINDFGKSGNINELKEYFKFTQQDILNYIYKILNI